MTGFDKLLREYLDAIRLVRSEAERADRFRDFVRKVFPDVEVGGIRGFYPGLERYLKTVGVGQVVRGRADALFGSLVVEFESVLDKAHEDKAREQLSKYVVAIWSAQADLGQPRGRLTAVATDGVVFVVYSPRSLVSRGPVALEQVILEEVDRVDISSLKAEDAYVWLKRYIITAAGELRPIDPDEFAREFGVGSRVFRETIKKLEAGWGKAKADSIALYEQWDSHLRIVYGSAVGSEELYLRHTYLATLAKLVVYSAYSGGALPVSREELVKILDGSIFREWRIVNFIEEDLFSWVHRVDEGVEAAQFIASGLSSYDLTTVTLDVFKEIYQGLVDPEARHDLGEYYTPDWLAEMIVGDVVGDNPYQSVLDPACGSGTFLAAAISLKKQRIKDLKPAELLNHILGNVVGLDVHPLAVIISRATYLTTLGRELLEYRVGDLVVPVYLSDSINLPTEATTVQGGVKVYSVSADGLELVIPADLAEYPLLADSVVDAVRDYAKDVVSGVKSDLAYFRSYIMSRVPKLKALDFGIIQALYYTANNLVNLTNRKRDTVWGFILKNYYKPIFLNKRKFDAVVGNPPWIIYKNIKSEEYQKFVYSLIVDLYKMLSQTRADMVWVMEVATLFLVRTAELYVNENGTISFVMTRGVLAA
ncbi:MAG: N-6 DNA methylase, partial [Candidatus Caldarchaeum sp.]